jgi:hypothetical protein
MIKILPLLFLLFTISKLSSQNLIENPNFENGFVGWIPFSTDAANTSETIVNAIPFSGISCFQVSINSTNTVTAGILQHISVVPLQHYLLEYYVRTDSVNGLSFPYLNFGSGTTVNYEYGLMPINGSTGWKYFQSRFTIPAGNNNDLTLFLFFSGTNGRAYFDDMNLILLNDTTYSDFSVDIAGSSGIIKNLSGTNTGPLKLNNSVNLTSNFQQAGINYVRTHDYYGACDISTIFPDTSKIASDSSAYSFSSSDSVITATINAGSKILFRFGNSYEGVPKHNIPPADMEKWAEVCLQIVKHYNEGWNNGFYYNIKEWEIWNEPDNYSFWTGTAADFVKLYRLTATKLKQYDNSLQIGGPAIASIFNSNFLNAFLDSVKTENLPLDFFSYHIYYIANPYHFKYVDSITKAILANYSLQSVKRYVTEWNPMQYSGNINQLEVWHNDLYISSQAASVMTYWQEDGPEKVFWYRTDEYLFGLFNESNGKFTFSGRTFEIVNYLNQTPFKLPSTGNDNLGKTLLAGKSISGDSINILISDHASSKNGYFINMNSINGDDIYYYKHYRIMVSDSLSMISSGAVSADNPIILITAKSPFTDLIKLTKSTTIGVQDLSNKFSCKLLIKPEIDIININYNSISLSGISIEIYNELGFKIFKSQFQNNSIEISTKEFSSGIYFCKIQSGGYFETKKFIIIR